MAALTEQRTDVDGVPVRWLELGTGPAVVLIHGIPTSPALWRHVVPHVPGARLLAWEMVGYGLSRAAGIDRDISVKAQAGYLRRWLADLGVERAVLVGHDLGGGVVQIAAVEDPSACAGIVLTNSIAYDSWPIPSVRAMRRVAPVMSRMPRPLFRGLLEAFIARGHDDRAIARESAAAHRPGYDHPDGPAAFVRQITSLRTRDTLDVADQLPRLRVPAEVVWGGADGFQKLGYGQRLARDLSAGLEVVERGKHFMPEDHPEEVAAAIRRTLERAA